MFVTYRHLGQVGRLGNQLFQIATTIGVARRNGLEFVFPMWPFAKWFEVEIPQASVIASTRTRVEQDFAYQEITVNEPTSLLGFFQSERYFQHCEAEIRAYFQPHPQLRRQLQSQFDDLLKQKTCSVHVRRGDYVGHPDFVDLATTDYYEEAFRQFDRDTTYIFFSDDIPWCKKRFHDERFVFVEGHKSIVDMFLMSFCDGHIVANSSFSWWGAWLNPNEEKKVIAPATWFAGERTDLNVPFHPGPKYRGFHDTKDLIPEGWIRL